MEDLHELSRSGSRDFFDPAEFVEAGPAERSASEDFH